MRAGRFPPKRCGAGRSSAIGRRAVLFGSLWPFAAPAWAKSNAGNPLAAGGTLLIAGPHGGMLEGLATSLLAALERRFPKGTVLHATAVGGFDSVTAANQFDAWVMPDGLTALVVPGSAVIAWLVGAPRVQFDLGRWMPVTAALAPAVLLGSERLAELRPGGRAPVRLALSDFAGPELAGLLGLSLGRVDVTPVVGLRGEAAFAALHRGIVDLLMVQGAKLGPPAELSRYGFKPLLALGVPSGNGGFARAPAYPELPTLSEWHRRWLGTSPTGALARAWGSLVAAAQLIYALVLPQLTPAAMVALWRQCADAAVPDLAAAAPGQASQLLERSSEAMTLGRFMAAPPEARLALKEWLANRYQWRPS